MRRRETTTHQKQTTTPHHHVITDSAVGNRPSQNTHDGHQVNYRLPTHLRPSFYEIVIKPYFNVTTQPIFYDGHVSIRFSCVQDTSKLVLHMVDLDIDNSSLELIKLETTPRDSQRISDSVAIRNFAWTHDVQRQFFVADFGYNIFVKGREYVVNIGFKGYTKDDNAGFYASSYRDANSQKR